MIHWFWLHMIMAIKIMAAVKDGEHDPLRLTQFALKAARPL
jgi:hypothetical protein